MHYLHAASEHPWWHESLDSRLASISTMVSPPELKMLAWLARNQPMDDEAVIVDAGCFLGGSTAALAVGLRDNPSAARKEARIVAYDRFDAGGDRFMTNAAKGGNKASDDLLIQFRSNLGELNSFVTIVCGDFHFAPPPDAPISILFIDVAKTWSLNQRVVSGYFSKLREGSVVVQQDHNDHCCPWVGLTMEHFAPYFEHILDERSSRLYRVVKAIPLELLSQQLEHLPYRNQLDLLERARARDQGPVPIYMSAVSQAWLIYAEEGAEAAKAYLDRLPPQPWQSESPYADVVRNAISHRESKRNHVNPMAGSG